MDKPIFNGLFRADQASKDELQQVFLVKLDIEPVSLQKRLDRLNATQANSLLQHSANGVDIKVLSQDEDGIAVSQLRDIGREGTEKIGPVVAVRERPDEREEEVRS